MKMCLYDADPSVKRAYGTRKIGIYRVCIKSEQISVVFNVLACCIAFVIYFIHNLLKNEIVYRMIPFKDLGTRL